MNATTIFPKLTAAVNAHYDNAAAKFAADLDSMTNAAALNSWYMRDRMTPAALEMVKNADPAALIPAAAQKKMLARFNRENENDRRRYLDKLERAAQAPEIDACVIPVEWVNSRMWGKNPTCTIAYQVTTTGRASGCGYDKESAAISSAMNAHPAIMRILYTHAENGEKFPYSVNTFAGIPYFDGGCGVSCFYNVFRACGYEFKDVSHRPTFDCYQIVKQGLSA